MLSCFFLAIVGAVTVQSGDAIAYTLEKPNGDNMNGSGWQISRVVISKDNKENTVCGGRMDNATILVLCSMKGYMKYDQLDPDESLTWARDLSIGYSAKCTKWDDLDSCTITDNTACTKLLVINCTSHYEMVLGGGVSTNGMLIPAILIPVCILYVIVLCYLESVDVRKTEKARKQTLKGEPAKTNKSKEGSV